MSNTEKNKEKKVISVFNWAFFILVFMLYFFVYNYIDNLPNDVEYMNPLVLTLATLFFGTSMKATYDILINIYFGFEEDIPKYYKKGKVQIHSFIDFISIGFVLIVIVKFINNFTIALAITIFFVAFLMLTAYMYLSKKILTKKSNCSEKETKSY